MEKRGQAEVLQITLLFEFIAGVLIAGILIYAVMNINDTSDMTGQYLQQDYCAIKDIMLGKPGDYKAIYPIGIFTVEGNEFKKPDTIKITGDNNVTIKKDYNKIEMATEK
jgi:hypothetical protein